MENKSSYQINEQGVLGEVKIADDDCSDRRNCSN